MSSSMAGDRGNGTTSVATWTIFTGSANIVTILFYYFTSYILSGISGPWVFSLRAGCATGINARCVMMILSGIPTFFGY